MLLVKNLLFTIFVPGTVAILVPYRIVSRSTAMWTLNAAQLLLAAPVLALGLAIYFWCLWGFAVAGRGTPAPIDPLTQLVVRGLYRRIRNPMYIGVLLVVTAWVVAFRSVAVLEYGVTVALAFHLFVVFVEEPLLRRRFGAAYESYCHAVPRWVPRRRPLEHA